MLQQMSIQNRKYKRSSQDRQTPSQVLLVCVYDTLVIEITNEAVYARFSPFEPIIKILIFQRGEVSKFFIEFSSVENAYQAKRYLDGTKLFESICKMSIYYSNFRSVDLKHQTSQGVIFENENSLIQEQFLLDFNSLYTNNGLMSDYCFNSTLLFPSFSLRGYDSESDQQQDVYCSTNILKQSLSSNISVKQLQKTIENDINYLLQSDKKQKGKRIQHISQQKICQQGQISCYLCFDIEEETSNQNIYNLFSSFGNISYIKQTSTKVFLKFRTKEFAAIARNYLEGYRFLGNILQFKPLLFLIEAQPIEQQYSEISFYDESFDRFTPSKSITINPPSQTLHVSSIKRDACKVQYLRRQFQRYGSVQKIQILNHGSDRNMALIKFATMDDSFNAMSAMHNKNLLGRKIQISFTKSKLH